MHRDTAGARDFTAFAAFEACVRDAASGRAKSDAVALRKADLRGTTLVLKLAHAVAIRYHAPMSDIRSQEGVADRCCAVQCARMRA